MDNMTQPLIMENLSEPLVMENLSFCPTATEEELVELEKVSSWSHRFFIQGSIGPGLPPVCWRNEALQQKEIWSVSKRKWRRRNKSVITTLFYESF